MVLTAKVLLTIVTLGYSAIPTFFDLSDSHATNPSWTGHARYHVIWQVSSYDLIAVVALGLTWTAGADGRGLGVPALIALAAYGGFWIAWATRPLYGGVLRDEVNGVPDVRYGLLGRRRAVDANVAVFLPLTALTLASAALVLGLPAADAGP